MKHIVNSHRMNDLRIRLGREPTDADIEAEKEEERRRNPLRVISYEVHVPPAVKVDV